MPHIFEEWREDWSTQRAMMRELMTDEEINAARATTLNAHYTDPRIVDVMWGALEKAGVTSGRVLEPGSGSGTFIGRAPQGVEMVGVELDPLTAKISAALYPDAQIRVEGFQHAVMPTGAVNAVIGNVPFGGFSLIDPRYNPRRLSIHNHFISKSLQLTAPGGVVAVISSSFTMDAATSTARAEFARYGDLIGAVRLPSGRSNV